MSIRRCLIVSTVLLAGCGFGMAQKKAEARPEDLFVSTQQLEPRPATRDLSFVGPVSQNLWTFNALSMYEPEWKTEVFYTTSFTLGGNPPQTGQLIELDYIHHRARAWTMPVGIGSWNIIRGQDGNLYFGTYNGGTLLCFNPRTKQWVPLPQSSESFRRQEFIITDLVQTPNGDIYYGTYPGAHLVRYRPKDQSTTDLGRVTDEMYLRWIAATPSGIILAGTGPKHGKVTAYDPGKGSLRIITPEEQQTAGVFSKPLATGRYVVEAQQQPGAKVLVYDPLTFELKHTYSVPGRNNGAGNQSAFTVIDDNHVLYQDDEQQLMSLDLTTGQRSVLFAHPGTAANNRWYFDSKGNILGLLVQSYVYLDRRTQKVVHQTIPFPRAAQDVLWLSTASDGRIYGGPPLGQNLFSYDPTKSLLTSYDQVVDRTGEIYYGIELSGKIYSISYAEAGLSVFDPHQPWNPGETPSSNPRAIAYLQQDQNRPIAGIHKGPMDRLYIGTQPGYGLLGGAISVFDPASERIEIHRNLIPDEEITALAADDRYVYATADPQGGAGSTPTARGSHFLAWDPRTNSIAFDQVYEDGEPIRSIAVARGHAYFVRKDAIMDYDAAQKTLSVLLRLEGVKVIPAESLRAAADGSIFGIFSHTLARFNPSSRTIDFYGETAGRAISGLTIGTDGTVYFGSYTEMGIFHPKSPSPPLSFGQ